MSLTKKIEEEYVSIPRKLADNLVSTIDEFYYRLGSNGSCPDDGYEVAGMLLNAATLCEALKQENKAKKLYALVSQHYEEFGFTKEAEVYAKKAGLIERAESLKHKPIDPKYWM